MLAASADPAAASLDQADAPLAQALAQAATQITSHIARRIKGQAPVIEQLLVTLFAGGHGLFVGVPGLAKTTLVHSMAAALGLRFSRLQFTPDLMPSDITGTEVLEPDAQGRRSMKFLPGPLFANLVLADEINRTPPKTQAALLQAMQEGCITAGHTTHQLPPPFVVFATQNPAEQHGTYPLPEAQLDRFMMRIEVDYPSFDAEVEILREAGAAPQIAAAPVLSAEQLQLFQGLCRRVPVADSLLQDTVRLVRATRPADSAAGPAVRQYVQQGAGPRAAQHLLQAARARALLQGRATVDREDLEALRVPVLQHRLILNFSAEGSGIRAADLLREIKAGL